MQRKLIVFIAFFIYCFSVRINAQIILLGSFNPSGASSLCGIGYEPDSSHLWIYGCSASTIQSYTTSGVLLKSFTAPGGTANDVDVEIAPEQLSINNSIIPEGQLLFVNGESGTAEIFAMDNVSGGIIETLTTDFGASHVVGGSYHPVRNTFFVVQDNVPSTSLENLIAEIDPVTGDVIQSFQITSFFSVSYGDIEVGANGNLFVVSSIEDSIAEITPLGDLVTMHALPEDVVTVSGIAIDCAAGEAWVSSTSGNVYHLGQFPGGSPLNPTITADGPTTFCKGDAVTLSVAAPGELTYAWKKGSSFLAGETNSTYTPTKAGNYCVLVSNACESVLSNKISVTVNPKPEANFTQGACSGGAVLLTRTGTPATGVTYKWKLNSVNIAGATNATYSVTVSGSYKVEVKITATGCKKTSAAQTVTVNCRLGSTEAGFIAEAYPNPFNNSVMIEIGGSASELIQVKLTDFYGRTIREYNNISPSSSFEINEDLAPGVYFVKLNSENGLHQIIKLVKVK